MYINTSVYKTSTYQSYVAIVQQAGSYFVCLFYKISGPSFNRYIFERSKYPYKSKLREIGFNGDLNYIPRNSNVRYKNGRNKRKQKLI